jgi:hypothetical protein
MSHVTGRTRMWVALLSGSLVFAGGIAGALAQEGSKAAEERGRMGAVELAEQARPPKAEPPQAVAAEVKARMVTGTVTAIDREARSVVLREDLSGEELTVEIPDDATSFDQLKVGDRMDVNLLQPLELTRPSPVGP